MQTPSEIGGNIAGKWVSQVKLQDILNLDWVININEVFDTNIEPDNWVTGNDGVLIGNLTIDNEHFQIHFEPKTFSISPHVWHFVNISFVKIVNGIASQALTIPRTNASKIIGAIINATEKQLKKYNWDAIVFRATDNVDHRMRIYNSTARDYHQLFGFVDENIPTSSGGKMTVLFNKSFSQEHYQLFKQYLITQAK